MAPTKEDILAAGEEAIANQSREKAEAYRKATAGMGEEERKKYELREGGDYDRWGKKCGCSAEEFRKTTWEMVKTDEDVRAGMIKVLESGNKYRTDEEQEGVAKLIEMLSGAGGKK
eukprot:g11569.t1